MLYPQSNQYRQSVQLAGFWSFRFDPEDTGLAASWQSGFSDGRPIVVPASWNDQFEDGRDFLGPAWYKTSFGLPWGWKGKRIVLRFGSVNYLASVWLNGQQLGTHEGGHLPFEFDVTPLVREAENQLVVRVDGRLAFDRVPPGNVTGDDQDFFASHAGNFPQAQFDFFPFCGIHRPVLLYATQLEYIVDITVETSLAVKQAQIHIRVEKNTDSPGSAVFQIEGHGYRTTAEAAFSGHDVEVDLEIPDAALWSPAAPNLYELVVDLGRGGEVVDSYSLKIGVRTIRVEEIVCS